MPRYNYKCTNVNCDKFDKIIEQQRTVADRNKEIECECGKFLERTVELSSHPQFRGSGWTPKFGS